MEIRMWNFVHVNIPKKIETKHCSDRGSDKSLARPGRIQARKHVSDARGFNYIETRAVIKFLFFSCKARR